jgi:DNA-binding NarL/FixJ family response regulator
MIRVVIVDDQALVREGFARLLRDIEDLQVVGEAGDGATAVDLVARVRPDVVVMDVRMPRMDGIEATEHIVHSNPDVRVLVLTTFDLDEAVGAALQAGASGFLLKDTPAAQFVHAIRVISRGEAILAPTVTRRLIQTMTQSAVPTPHERAALARLTTREQQILRLLAAGMSNAEIGSVTFLSEATVKTHVSRVLAKLECRDRVQAVVLAYRTGFVSTTPR